MVGIQPTKYIWANGKLVNWEDAKVHVMTHGLHYGTGVFEGIRSYQTPLGPAVFRLKDHLDRMDASARILRMQLPYSSEQLRSAVRELIKKNGLTDAYIRPIAFFGVSGIGVNPTGYPVDLFIAAFHFGAYLGEDGLKKGIRVGISSWRRISPASLATMGKICGHYVNSALAITEAKAAGYDEAILLNEENYVAEGSGENIFIVKDDVLKTPPLSAGILPGITRDTVMRIAKEEAYRVEETNITRSELYVADEVFMVGTAAEITPIREIDQRPVGKGMPGPVTKRLQDRFWKIVKGENELYHSWLDFVDEG
jgi:branched-chain amino acid aminotransferase